VIPGDDADAKDSARIPRFCVYYVRVVAMLFTVSTRWSRDMIAAALIGEGIMSTIEVMGIW
jgi:hypothetical protein